MTSFKSYCLIGAVITLSFISCKNPLSGYPTTANCSFDISSLLNYDCWAYHPLSPPQSYLRKIKLRCNILTYYYNSSGTRTLIDDQATIFDPTVNSFPVTINALIATNKLFEVECNVQGIECSECALGYGGSNSSDLSCTAQSQIEPNGTISYKGANPRWQGVRTYQVQTPAPTSISFSNVSRIMNVPNSCGCRVYE